MSETATLDSRALRQTLGQFATGVTIVTCRMPCGTPVGMTANSFASVSLDPPLVLWSVDRTARSFEAFADAQDFAFCVLAQDQAALSNQFAKPGADKFAAIALEQSEAGVPLITGCAARIECTKHSTFPGGDHLIIVGRVTRFVRYERRPLVFAQGRYGVVASHPGTVGGHAQERDAAQMHPYDDFLVPLLFRAYNHMLRAFANSLVAADATGEQMRILAILAAAGPATSDVLLTRTMLSRSNFEDARQALIGRASLATKAPTP